MLFSFFYFMPKTGFLCITSLSGLKDPFRRTAARKPKEEYLNFPAEDTA